MLNKNLYMLGFCFTVIFSQNIWTGTSVATSDNLDVFSLNPAGFGVSRGTQNGFYMPVDKDDFTIFKANRYGNFGYSLEIKENDPWDHLTGVGIGFGTKIGNGNYIGIRWNKTKAVPISSSIFTIGAMIRPWDFLSIGATASLDERQEISNFPFYRIGIALRPLSNHRLTIGVDYMENNQNDLQTIHPFANIKLVDGINLSLSTEMDLNADKMEPEGCQLNIGFNVNKFGAYSIQDGDSNIGIGFYSSAETLPSIFSKKKKDSRHYIRMDLSGNFIEEKPSEVSFITNILFPSSKGTQLRGWLEKMDEYTDDSDIHGLIIDIGSVGGGFAKKNEMRRALQRFKDAGKEIIVYSEYGLSGGSYFLISMADEIFMSGSTGIELKGLNIEVSFYRTLLDTLSIVPEVFRVNYDGKSYKTMGDPFLYSGMTDEFRENYTELFQGLYDIWVKGISEGREWTTEETKNVINNGPYYLLDNAKNAGLIDSVMFKDQFDDYVDNLNDGKNTVTKIEDIDSSEYYVNDWAPKEKEKIAVIYAVGSIMPGNSNPGPSGSSIMGDKTIMKAIKSARENKDVKAIVLRIDSGGGSVLASDNMWREIYRTTTEDTTNVKPFIASMSDVAASGGYYIACEADSILADEATITGSIGVIGLRFNTSELMKRIGINTESITFGDNADFATGSRLISDEHRARIQESINETYTDFKQKVSDGRDNISEEDNLDDIALGRVFTGKQASDLDLFLVDKLGGIYEAIETAKNAAGIDGDVEIIEYPKRDIKSSFQFSLGMKTSIQNNIIDELPYEIKKHYDAVELINVLSSDTKHMIFPYKIEVK